MNENTDLPRKDVDEARGSRGHGVRSGRLKDGRRASVALKEQNGRSKPDVEKALAAAPVVRKRGRRTDWGPQVAPRSDERPQAQSVRLRLEVEKGRIRVLDSSVVDVPAPDAPTVRGTTFIEVRAGDAVVALQPLIDPGVSIGIPDPGDDPKEFRGHRVVEEAAWETVVRVPLEAVARVDAGELSVAIYTASERLVLTTDSTKPLAKRSRAVEELAVSGPLSAELLPHEVTRGEGRKYESDTTSAE